MKRCFLFLLLTAISLCGYGQRNEEHDAMEKKYGEPGAEKLEEWMNGKLLNVKIEPEYRFPLGIRMHTTSYKNGTKKQESDMQFYMNAAEHRIGIKVTDEKKKKADEMLI